jgi:hypothetical protein
VDLRTGFHAAATGALLEALGIFRDLGHQRGVARQLERLSWCAGLQQRDEAAVRLAGAATAIRQRIGAPIKAAERARVDETLARARARIDPDAYEVAWRVGRTAALDAILQTEPTLPPEGGPSDISAGRSDA